MKKLLTVLAEIFIFAILSPTISAFAAETGAQTDQAYPRNEVSRRENNVTITVVMPERETEQDTEPEPFAEPTSVMDTDTVPEITLYPADVTETRENGGRQIIKTYELSDFENPAYIPRNSFERGGWLFSLTDITKREMINAETRAHKETVTVNTDTKELEQILSQLTPTMEYKTEDGFVGFLYLDISSIKVETAGTKTTSYTASVTREYPRLPNTDSSNIPKTVEDKGKTYTLAGVEWKAGNYVTVDYEQIAEYYTAIASYTATGYSTKVTGYITTADYNGSLAKLAQGKTVYTAYFEGCQIRAPLSVTETPKAETPPDEQKETVSKPTGTPADISVNVSADKPVNESVDISVNERTATNQANETAENSIEKPAAATADKPTDESESESSDETEEQISIVPPLFGNNIIPVLFGIIGALAFLLCVCAFILINKKGANR